MAVRNFSAINTSITRSRKLRGLDHRARWAWLCAHLKADYLGLAEYPVSVWSVDAELTAEELECQIKSLVDAGLIDWFADAEIIRVTGFIKQRPPDNASTAKRLRLDLVDRLYAAEPELENMLLEVTAEFAVASVARSLRWDKDRPKFRQDMGEFLRGVSADFDGRFLDALSKEAETSGRPTRNELEGLLPYLSLHRQSLESTPSPHRVDTQDVDETRRIQNQDKDKNEDLDGASFCVEEITSSVAQSSGGGIAEKRRMASGPRPETLASVIASIGQKQ